MTTTAVELNGTKITGTLISAVDIVALQLNGAQGAGGKLSGAYNGSVDFYLSCDGGLTFERTVALWTPAGSSGTPRIVDSVGSSSSGFFQFLFLAGATHIALSIPTWSSGTVNVVLFTTPQVSAELTAVGVEGINGPQSPRLVTVGGVDTAGLSRVLRLASPILFRDLGATPQTIKASGGTLFGVHIENNQAAAAWIQLFNATGPTVGTTNPDLEKLVAANQSGDVSLPANGVLFGTAIKIASTTTEKGATTSAAGVQVFAQFA